MKEATGQAQPKQERPVTLFTGQWADLPFTEVCRRASDWGYDGWEDIFRMLNHLGYAGAISIEREDAGMDRLAGAPKTLEFIRRMNAITPPPASFDAAFATRD